MFDQQPARCACCIHAPSLTIKSFMWAFSAFMLCSPIPRFVFLDSSCTPGPREEVEAPMGSEAEDEWVVSMRVPKHPPRWLTCNHM